VDKLLLASYKAEREKGGPITAEDLVVKAWEIYPDTFGLKGHADAEGNPKFPDSNRVYAEIMGSKPLRKKGLLTKVGTKTYKLTEYGRDRAIALSGQLGQVSRVSKISLSREDVTEIERLMKSRANQKIQSDNSGELNFFDACEFWRINPSTRAKELGTQFVRIEKLIEKAVDLASKKESVSIIHGGVSYNVDSFIKLKDVHEELKKRFNSEIEHIEKRIHDKKKK